jgi:hypothetical protein
MKRYVNAVFGGILAMLAAFGWTITLAFAIALRYQGGNRATGFGAIGAYNGPALWIVMFLIFSAGFFLAFRKIY